MSTRYNIERIKIQVGAKDSVSAEIFEPSQYSVILTLAHGAGTNMDHASLIHLAGALADEGIGVVRFNFLYTERGRKMPDRLPAASLVIRGVVEYCAQRFGGKKLFLGGKSFGGRMSSQYMSAHQSAEVSGLVFYGFPLHPAGNPSVTRAEHLNAISVPMLFLQGTRDQLAYAHLIHQVTSSLPLATLIELDGFDHSFRKGKQTGIPTLAAQTLAWINNHA